MIPYQYLLHHSQPSLWPLSPLTKPCLSSFLPPSFNSFTGYSLLLIFYRISNFLSLIYHLIFPSLFLSCSSFSSFFLSLLLSNLIIFSLINCSLLAVQIWAVLSSKLLDYLGLKRSLPSHSLAPCCEHQDEVMNASTYISLLLQSLSPSSSLSPSLYSTDCYLWLVCSGDTGSFNIPLISIVLSQLFERHLCLIVDKMKRIVMSDSPSSCNLSLSPSSSSPLHYAIPSFDQLTLFHFISLFLLFCFFLFRTWKQWVGDTTVVMSFNRTNFRMLMVMTAISFLIGEGLFGVMYFNTVAKVSSGMK